MHGEQAVRALHILNLMAGASGGVLRHGAREAGFPSDRAHGTGLVEVMTDRWALPNPVKRTIPTGQIGEAILNPDSHGGPVNAALVMWGNPVGQAGNAHKTERALRSLDFCAVADVFMTPTAKCADVVLPASTWLERCATTEGMEAGSTFYHLAHELTPKHILLYTPGVMPPRGESLDDFEIICRLAEKMGYGAHFPWKSSKEWMEELLEAARADARFPWFKDVTLEKLEAEGQITLDVPDAAPRWDLTTPHGRAQVYFEEIPQQVPTHFPPEEDVADERADYPLHLLTPKTYFRASSTFNNATKLLRHGWNVATLHPADAAARGIANGDSVRLKNDFGESEFEARVSEGIRPGVVHVPSGGLPENGAANQLTGDALSEYENATFNSYHVEVEKS